MANKNSRKAKAKKRNANVLTSGAVKTDRNIKKSTGVIKVAVTKWHVIGEGFGRKLGLTQSGTYKRKRLTIKILNQSSGSAGGSGGSGSPSPTPPSKGSRSTGPKRH